MALALGGCSPDTSTAGQIGVTVDAAGDPVLVMVTCKGRLDRVALSLGGQGGKNLGRNLESMGEWTLSDPPAADTVEIPLAAETVPSWSVTRRLPKLEVQTLYSALAFTKDRKWTTGQADFRPSDLSVLDESTVLYHSRIVPRKSFRAKVCADMAKPSSASAGPAAVRAN